MAESAGCGPACSDLSAGDLGGSPYRPVSASCLPHGEDREQQAGPQEETAVSVRPQRAQAPPAAAHQHLSLPVPPSWPPPPPATGASGPHIRAPLRSADCPASCWAHPSLKVSKATSVLLHAPRTRALKIPPAWQGDEEGHVVWDPGIRQWQAALGPPTGEKVTAPRVS